MSIVNPNVLELLEHSDSRYTLVVEASKRGRQIVGGSQPLIDNTGMKPLKTAVEEINRGLLAFERPVEEEEATSNEL
ncbi:MAG: DNA-directed RNA polymerase subunit omega [Clostridia bacterium]|nr:DNA-directed RNA polymerase subunit omega [Clostridia bacterium]